MALKVGYIHNFINIPPPKGEACNNVFLSQKYAPDEFGCRPFNSFVWNVNPIDKTEFISQTEQRPEGLVSNHEQIKALMSGDLIQLGSCNPEYDYDEAIHESDPADEVPIEYRDGVDLDDIAEMVQAYKNQTTDWQQAYDKLKAKQDKEKVIPKKDKLSESYEKVIPNEKTEKKPDKSE